MSIANIIELPLQHKFVYTAEEVARLFNISVRHVEVLCQKGVLTHERISPRVIRINGPALRKQYPHLFNRNSKDNDDA